MARRFWKRWACEESFQIAGRIVRDGKFANSSENSWEGWIEFQTFLAESETLREWGQNWKQDYAKARPPLPADVWHVPDDWQVPAQRNNRPPVGGIPHMDFEAGFLDDLDLKPVV